MRVVGVALLETAGDVSRVLAARRTAPPELAGRWELPGGKCGPDETLEDAARREVLEELGCTIEVTGRLDGVSEIRPGLVLHVVVGRLLDGVPVATEHDELRWLAADELLDVDWLPADVPFFRALAVLLRAAPEAGP